MHRSSRFVGHQVRQFQTLAAGTRGLRFYSGKDVKYGNECRALMLQGVEKLAQAVETTLGPKGRNVILDEMYGPPKITKDGVTVAKHVEFKDRYMNLGAQLVRSVATKTNDIAGDGTTTATVLTRAIFAEGCKAVAAGMNPTDLRRGIMAATDFVVAELKAMSRSVTTVSQIAQVATISANGDAEIGELLATAMEKVGRSGVITIETGKTLKDELEVTEGMKLDTGLLSHVFVTDSKKSICEFEDPLILVTDKKINTLQQLLPILEKVMQARRKLLIIADTVEGDALSTLVLNRLRGAQVAAMKAPGFAESRKHLLQDIAVLTDAQLISDEMNLKIENVELKHLGTAKKVVCSINDTVITGGGGSKESIQERCDLIQANMDNTPSAYDKKKYQERLAKLSGGVAVVYVGGASEVEVGEKKDRIVDALNATQAAVDEGIVPGGGTALLYASQKLSNLKVANFDQEVGVKIIKNALKVPCKAIANNAGVDGSVVVGKLLDFNDTEMGYNAQTDTYENMYKAGIIDPTKVVRTALVDAAGVASLMTTTEAMVVELPRDEKAPPMGMGGGMPGMGGMGGMF